MTPNHVEILVYACVCSEVHPRRGAPAVEEAIREFVKIGAIELCDEPNMIRATPMGRVWLRSICETPAPRQAWINDKGEVIA